MGKFPLPRGISLLCVILSNYELNVQKKMGEIDGLYVIICIFEVIKFVQLKPLLIGKIIVRAEEILFRWNK